MPLRFKPIVFVAGVALVACAPAPRPQAQAPTPMAGTGAGSAADPLSTASRERAGAGCPDASSGVASLGTTGGGDRQITYAGRGTGSGVGDRSRRIAPGGAADSCN
ncbi:hypothetical protein GCM10009416_40180 [Craurococcus roseus]|uniref:Lipoprotein n=1 Tax=Craurococcus roseus TaxID=77585 RepID=A0ABN1FUC3_9PROT